jgi:gas vesicle protein
MFSKLLKFTLGIALGTGIGVTTAMLLAPASGEETRASMQDRLSEIGDNFRRAQLEKEQEMRSKWEAEIDLEGQREREDKHDKARAAR